VIALALDLYCTVYLDGRKTNSVMREALVAALGGEFEGRRLRFGALGVDLFDNSIRGEGEGFLYWPFYLEIEADPEPVDDASFVTAIRSLLGRLKAQGVRTTTACDFEDQLQDIECP